MTYTEQLQRIVREYRQAGRPWPAHARDIAAWAVANNHWQPQPSTIVKQCADEIARAMQEEYITDPQGRRVRAKHAAIYGEQAALWADIRDSGPQSRIHMEIAFQNRRQQIVGDCRQLKADVDSFNENWNVGSPIQMVFDFTHDLEELELMAS